MDNVDNISTSGNMGQPHVSGPSQREHDIIVEITKLRSEVVQIREARDKQALEYERRLEALNHENARVQSAQDTFLPRETYEAASEGLRLYREGTATKLEVKAISDKLSVLKDEAAVKSDMKSLTDRVIQLEKNAENFRGERGGADSTLRWVISGIGVMATIAALLSVFAAIVK
jgi:hypothetical protein